MVVSLFEVDGLLDDYWIASFVEFYLLFLPFFAFLLFFLLFCRGRFLLAGFLFLSFLGIFLLILTLCLFKLRRCVHPGHDRAEKHKGLFLLQVTCLKRLDHVVDLLEAIRHQIIDDHITFQELGAELLSSFKINERIDTSGRLLETATSVFFFLADCTCENMRCFLLPLTLFKLIPVPKFFEHSAAFERVAMAEENLFAFRRFDGLLHNVLNIAPLRGHVRFFFY